MARKNHSKAAIVAALQACVADDRPPSAELVAAITKQLRIKLQRAPEPNHAFVELEVQHMKVGRGGHLVPARPSLIARKLSLPRQTIAKRRDHPGYWGWIVAAMSARIEKKISRKPLVESSARTLPLNLQRYRRYDNSQKLAMLMFHAKPHFKGPIPNPINPTQTINTLEEWAEFMLTNDLIPAEWQYKPSTNSAKSG